MNDKWMDVMTGFNGTNIDDAGKATPPERGAELRVMTAPLNTLRHYRYSVIFAQYNGQWLFCRHKDRQTWETPGGHIEQGETPLEAAKRELFEETGAVEFEIYSAFDYKGADAETSATGQVFFAEVKTLGVIPPDSEIGEVCLFDAPPANWTYPQMQPGLFDKMCKWLGFDGKDDEIWDVYDENRKLTGRTHKRGDPLPDGDYHLVAHAWLMNDVGEFLILRRSLRKKGWAGMWENPAGSAIASEDGLTAAVREAVEESGITPSRDCAALFYSSRNNAFHDHYLFRLEFDLSDVVLQEGETIDAKKVNFQELCAMIYSGEFIDERHVLDAINALEEVLRKDGLKYADCAEFHEYNRLTDTCFENDKARWFEEHLPLAENGYALAECQVGWAYWKGVGVEIDLEKAMYWTARAAQHGDLDAINNLPEIRASLLHAILRKNKTLYGVLEKCADLALSDYYIGAGCVAQTVWNYQDGNDRMYGIDDIDLVYFDANLSFEAEDKAIGVIRERLGDVGVRIDIKNQARVHLWYNSTFAVTKSQ